MKNQSASSNKVRALRSNQKTPTLPIVAPSILAADIGILAQEIIEVDRAGADWLHVDVMDGSFVPPITFGDNVVKAARAVSKLFLDVHLMINNPDSQIQAFKDAGADRLIVHRETCPHLYRTLTLIRDLGMSPGVAINPGTAVSSIFDVLDVCDLVLVMTVNPGWGGQRFIESTLPKIEELRAEIERRKLGTLIEVDGGIDPQTAARAVAAGAQVLVAGSFIFNSDDKKEAISQLKRSLKEVA